MNIIVCIAPAASEGKNKFAGGQGWRISFQFY